MGSNEFGMNARPEDTNIKAAEHLGDRKMRNQELGQHHWCGNIDGDFAIYRLGRRCLRSLKSKLVPMPATTTTVSSVRSRSRSLETCA